MKLRIYETDQGRYRVTDRETGELLDEFAADSLAAALDVIEDEYGELVPESLRVHTVQ